MRLQCPAMVEEEPCQINPHSIIQSRYLLGSLQGDDTTTFFIDRGIYENRDVVVDFETEKKIQ